MKPAEIKRLIDAVFGELSKAGFTCQRSRPLWLHSAEFYQWNSFTVHVSVDSGPDDPPSFTVQLIWDCEAVDELRHRFRALVPASDAAGVALEFLSRARLDPLVDLTPEDATP